MKLLVIGASGLVGGKVAQKAMEMGAEVSGTYKMRMPPPGIPCFRLDVLDTVSVQDAISKESPDAVVNASALHDASYCERHPEEASLVNASSVGVLARACADTGAKLVHISTGCVFDGAKAPYVEYDSPAPLNAYGYSKFAGEWLALVPGHAVVRTSAVYGWMPAEAARAPSSGRSANFALRLLGSLSAKKRVKMAADRFATATLADWLAESLLAVAKSSGGGLFHAAGADCQSRYEFAVQLAEAFGHDADLVVPAKSAQLDQSTKTPALSCLDSSKVRRLLGVLHPPTGEALGIMRGQVERGAPELVGGR